MHTCNTGATPTVDKLATCDTGATPTIDKLAIFRIIDNVSDKWQDIGTHLGVSQTEQDNFRTKSILENATCCTLVFDHWIKNGGHPPHYPLSWEGVYDVLCAINHRGTADNMKECLAKEGITF